MTEAMYALEDQYCTSIDDFLDTPVWYEDGYSDYDTYDDEVIV